MKEKRGLTRNDRKVQNRLESRWIRTHFNKAHSESQTFLTCLRYGTNRPILTTVASPLQRMPVELRIARFVDASRDLSQ